MLGLLGVGMGLLVHQVAMHCFERGALMAALWNMHTALMDAEVLSLEEHIQVSPDAIALQRVQWQQCETLGIVCCSMPMLALHMLCNYWNLRSPLKKERCR